MTDTVVLGRPISLLDVLALARREASVAVDPAAREHIADTRGQLEQALAQGRTIYGVNTGFGALSDTSIAAKDTRALQLNLIRSHAMGVGAPLPVATVRAILALRAHTLALGASGVRPSVVDALTQMLAADVVPVVPCQGSVGASGDLAPLAHVALVLVGEGEAIVDGTRMSGAAALVGAGL